MNNIFPKVVFKQIPLELEVEMFFEFLNSNWGFWSKMIINKYPELSNVNNLKSKEDKLNFIETEITKIRSNLGKQLDINLEKIQSEWLKIESEYLKVLPTIIQTDWPNKKIIAHVSLNPVCPRNISSWSFSVTHDRKNTNCVIAHEISHFLFFKKLKEVFPDINKKNYEAPHKEWLLSELVAVVISHDPRILKITGVKDDFYLEHKKLTVGGKQLTEIISKLYNEYAIENNNFSEFIKKSLELLNDLQ